jgi:hypothetical protein
VKKLREFFLKNSHKKKFKKSSKLETDDVRVMANRKSTWFRV